MHFRLLLSKIIIISIFKEDNVFSMTDNLSYVPPVNTDIDYYRTFSDFFYFRKCCKVSCAICVRERRSPCLPENAAHQARYPLVPFLTPLVWHSHNGQKYAKRFYFTFKMDCTRALVTKLQITYSKYTVMLM